MKNQNQVRISDRRLHELLIRAELEDCKILEKDQSAYLAYWNVVDVPPEAAVTEARRSSPPAELVL
jgi:hypothetical protein